MARRGYRILDIDSIRRARAQFSGFPRRYTVIRYRTDRLDVCRTRKSDGDHDYVGLAQARPNYSAHHDTVLLQIFARSLFLRILRVNLQSQKYDRKNMIAIIKLIWRVVGGVS